MAEITLLDATTMADLLRILAVLLGGVSFGMTVALLPRLKLVWSREDLLAARMFTAVHGLVVVFVVSALAEHAGDPLSWRTPIALMLFSLKIAILALLRERVNARDLRADPPTRRVDDA